jgi:hypothetical protein
MSMRLAVPPGLARARIAVVVAALLSTVSGGLLGAAPAYADTAGGVSIDLGGAGGGGFAADVYGTGGSADTMPAGAPSFPNWGSHGGAPDPRLRVEHVAGR